MASSDIVLSAALRNNLLSLQSTQGLIDKVQLRLATGLKINSALDGPSQFFTSQSLTNRAGDLSRLLDGINLSIRSIEEADKGVTSLTNLAQQAKSVAQEAQSAIATATGFVSISGTKDLSAVADLVDPAQPITATTNTFSISIYRSDANAVVAPTNVVIADGDTIYDVAGTINSTGALNQYIRATVDAGGRLKITSLEEGNAIRVAAVAANSVTQAGFAYLGLDNYVVTENTLATTRQAGTAVAGNTVYSRAAASTAAVNGVYQASAVLGVAGANFATGFASATDSFNLGISIDGVVTTVGSAYQDTSTVQDVIDDVNAANLGVTATFNTSTGKIELAFDSDISQAQIVITGGSAGVGVINFGFGTRITDVTTVANNVYSEAYTFAGTNVNLEQYQTDYNNIRDQIDDLVKDANFRGVNLLGGDTLTTFFNEDRSSKLETVGVDFTSAGLGINSANFITAGDVDDAINEIDNALDSIRNFGQSISNSLSILQTRSDFTTNTINTLKAGAGDLVNADQNEEGANLLALQTRQQLGVTALSLAAQSQQSVLRLF